MNADTVLPLIFLGLMGFAMLVYVVLDGYDLGVGILLRAAEPGQRDTMIAAIGPFWDANETWLVLGVGILLTAFPLAHGVILTALYVPVAIMLAGLILRGVAFDFRTKAHVKHKARWDLAFHAGSLLTSVAQGTMLGAYITGFDDSWGARGFALAIGLALAAGYALLGACWLVFKTEGALQKRALWWARRALWLCALGIAAISIATPLVSARIFERWFSLPAFIALLPIPLVTAGLFFVADRVLRRMPFAQDRHAWLPFVLTVAIFVLAFFGLAYSLFPYLVVDRLDVWQAASATSSLWAILIGAAISVPAIAAYTVFAYVVFRGKATQLDYG